MSEDVSKIRAALEILRVPNPKGTARRSWVKGILSRKYDGAERYCMVGALRHVGVTQFADTANSKDVRAILRVIREQFPDRFRDTRNIPSFNDHPTRTFDDVELVLEKAAILREEEGAESDWTLS